MKKIRSLSRMRGIGVQLVSHAYSVGFIVNCDLKITEVLAVLADLVTLYLPIAPFIAVFDLGVAMTIMTMLNWCEAVTAGSERTGQAFEFQVVASSNRPPGEI